MKGYSCSSGGVMFVEETIIRETNKQSLQKNEARSYKDIVGDDQADKKPMREKIFGVFVKTKNKLQAA